MGTLFRFVIRLVLLAAGLVFALSLLVAGSLLLLVWGLRRLWARLTGQPVTPFVMRLHPRDGFGAVFRAAGGGPRRRQDEPVASPRQALGDVTDVQAKPPRS
jgi:hypothetical protein